MDSLKVKRVNDLRKYNIDLLVNESINEGHNFIRRLKEEYNEGINCFNKEGEILLVILMNDEVIGIGGLNRDPYTNDDKIGRVRHVYVMNRYRKNRVATLLLKKIIEEASNNFNILRLRTNNPIADKLYCKLGFTRKISEYATHYMNLND